MNHTTLAEELAKRMMFYTRWVVRPLAVVLFVLLTADAIWRHLL